VPDHVVAEHAREPAAEARQVGQRGRAEALHEAAHELDRVALVALDGSPALAHLDRAAARGDARARGEPDERVAAEALAADDRFEQVGVARPGELEVERQRRVEVRERAQDERDAVVASLGERAEFGFGEHGCDPRNGGDAAFGGVLRMRGRRARATV